MRETLEISLLGGVAVRGRGNPGSTRAIGLLTYLALHADAPQSRSHLAGTFWPDSTDGQARTNLRRELHQLRGMLDDDGPAWYGRGEHPGLAATSTDTGSTFAAFLGSRAGAARRRDEGDVEALVRHGTASAVDAYRGSVAAGLVRRLGARRTARTLQQQCVDLCDRVVAARWLGAGDPAACLALARRRVQLAPLEELGYRQLMDLQAAARGDRAGAMTTYHRCASVLEQELGVEPLGRRPCGPWRRSSATDRPRAVRAGHPAPGVASSVDRPTRLIGRADELDLLGERWASGAAPAGRVLVLVTGEAGVGKSRLVTEFTQVRGPPRGCRGHRSMLRSLRSDRAGAGRRLAALPAAAGRGFPALERVWRVEVERLRAARSTGRLRSPIRDGPRSTPGNGCASSRDWPGRCWSPTGRRCWSWTTCSGATTTRCLWIVLPGRSARPRRRCCSSLTARDDELADNPKCMAAMRSLRSSGRVTEVALAPFSPEETAAAAGADARASPRQQRPVPAAVRDRRISALRRRGDPHVSPRVRPGWPWRRTTSAVSSSSGSPMRRTRPARWPAWRRPSDVTSACRCSARRATSRRMPLSAPSTSSGAAGSSDSPTRATTSPTTCFGRRRTPAVQPARRWLHHHRIAEAIERLHADRPDEVAGQVASHHARSGRPDLAAALLRPGRGRRAQGLRVCRGDPAAQAAT